MNPKSKKEFRHNKQVFNQENTKFVVCYEKTKNKTMTVSNALRELNIDKEKWQALKKQYNEFNGLNQ